METDPTRTIILTRKLDIFHDLKRLKLFLATGATTTRIRMGQPITTRVMDTLSTRPPVASLTAAVAPMARSNRHLMKSSRVCMF